MNIVKTIGFKAAGQGNNITDEQLAKINKYALVELKADQIYVRKYLMAHNGIDRDVERFSETLLDNFAKTLPGKGFFVEGHPSSWYGAGGPGEGKFFDAFTEEMTPEQFKEITGEDINLPEDVDKAKVLWGWAYVLKLPGNEETRAKIDAGIANFVSIGFNAKLNDVTDDKGNYKYGEYGPKGEAREGSIVWLGAQPGAAAKNCSNCPNKKKEHRKPEKQNKGGLPDMDMEKLAKDLSERLKTAITVDNIGEQIVRIVGEKQSEIDRLKSKADDGDAYRKELTGNALKYGTMLGEVEQGEEKQKTEEEFLMSLPIERLKMIAFKYEKRAREQFPDEFTFEGKDTKDKEDTAGKAKKKSQSQEGRKDYSDPENNELFATIGK